MRIIKKVKNSRRYTFKLFKDGSIIKLPTAKYQKIVSKINFILNKKNEVDKKGKSITVHLIIINNYLKQYIKKQKKIRMVFWCQNIKKEEGRILQKYFEYEY